MAAAIPIAIGALATAGTSAAVSAGLITAATAAFIVAGSQILGGYIASRLSSDQEYEALGQQDLKANTISGQRTIPVVYGRNRIGGNDLFVGVADDSIVVIQALCEGHVEGLETMRVPNTNTDVEAIFINGKPIYEFDTTYYVRVKENVPGIPGLDQYDKKTGTKIARTFQDGAHNQVAIPWVVSLFPEANDNYRYTAYVAFRIKAEGVSSLPRREVVIKGRVIYNTATGQTKYSSNPADILYDYLVDGRYGLGWNPNIIDIPSFASAANYASSQGFHTDFAITTPTKAQYVIDSILKYFRGNITWWNGKIGLNYSDARLQPTSFTVDDQVIAVDESSVSLVSVNEPDRSTKPSGLRVRYMSVNNETLDFSLDDFNIGESNAFVNQVDFPAFHRKESANAMGLYTLRRNANNRTYTATLRADMLQLEVGDLGYLTSSELLVTNILVRVAQTNFSISGLCTVVFMPESTHIYDTTPVDPSLPQELPEIFTSEDPPPPVENINVVEEVYDYRLRSYARIVVTYDPPEDYGWFSHANLYVSFNPLEIPPGQESLIGAPFPNSPYEPVLTNPGAYYNYINAGDLIFLINEPNPDERTKHVIGKKNGNVIIISDWSLGFDYQEFVVIPRETLKTISGSRDKAMIDPAEETQTYYVSPVAVSSTGTVQDYGTETLYRHTVLGVSAFKPEPLFNNDFSITADDYGSMVFMLDRRNQGDYQSNKRNDVYGYEVRFGDTFQNGIHVSTVYAQTGSINFIKPGTYKAWCSIFSTTGRYSDPVEHEDLIEVAKPLTFSDIFYDSHVSLAGASVYNAVLVGDSFYRGTLSKTAVCTVETPFIDTGDIRYPDYAKIAYITFNYSVSPDHEYNAYADIRASIGFSKTPTGTPRFQDNAQICYAEGVGRYIKIRFVVKDTTNNLNQTEPYNSRITVSNIQLIVAYKIDRWEALIR